MLKNYGNTDKINKNKIFDYQNDKTIWASFNSNQMYITISPSPFRQNISTKIGKSKCFSIQLSSLSNFLLFACEDDNYIYLKYFSLSINNVGGPQQEIVIKRVKKIQQIIIKIKEENERVIKILLLYRAESTRSDTITEIQEIHLVKGEPISATLEDTWTLEPNIEACSLEVCQFREADETLLLLKKNEQLILQLNPLQYTTNDIILDKNLDSTSDIRLKQWGKEVAFIGTSNNIWVLQKDIKYYINKIRLPNIGQIKDFRVLHNILIIEGSNKIIASKSSFVNFSDYEDGYLFNSFEEIPNNNYYTYIQKIRKRVAKQIWNRSTNNKHFFLFPYEKAFGGIYNQDFFESFDDGYMRKVRLGTLQFPPPKKNFPCKSEMIQNTLFLCDQSPTRYLTFQIHKKDDYYYRGCFKPLNITLKIFKEGKEILTTIINKAPSKIKFPIEKDNTYKIKLKVDGDDYHKGFQNPSDHSIAEILSNFYWKIDNWNNSHDNILVDDQFPISCSEPNTAQVNFSIGHNGELQEGVVPRWYIGDKAARLGRDLSSTKFYYVDSSSTIHRTIKFKLDLSGTFDVPSGTFDVPNNDEVVAWLEGVDISNNNIVINSTLFSDGVTEVNVTVPKQEPLQKGPNKLKLKFTPADGEFAFFYYIFVLRPNTKTIFKSSSAAALPTEYPQVLSRLMDGVVNLTIILEGYIKVGSKVFLYTGSRPLPHWEGTVEKLGDGRFCAKVDVSKNTYINGAIIYNSIRVDTSSNTQWEELYKRTIVEGFIWAIEEKKKQVKLIVPRTTLVNLTAWLKPGTTEDEALIWDAYKLRIKKENTKIKKYDQFIVWNSLSQGEYKITVLDDNTSLDSKFWEGYGKIVENSDETPPDTNSDNSVADWNNFPADIFDATAQEQHPEGNAKLFHYIRTDASNNVWGFFTEINVGEDGSIEEQNNGEYIYECTLIDNPSYLSDLYVREDSSGIMRRHDDAHSINFNIHIQLKFFKPELDRSDRDKKIIFYIGPSGEDNPIVEIIPALNPEGSTDSSIPDSLIQITVAVSHGARYYISKILFLKDQEIESVLEEKFEVENNQTYVLQQSGLSGITDEVEAV